MILGAVVLWLILVLLFIWKKKKDGKCIGCGGGGCAHCKKGKTGNK